MKAIQKNYIQALSKKIFGRQIFLRFLFFYIFLFSFPFPSLFSLSIFNSYFPVSLLILLKLKMSIWAKCPIWAVSISAWWSQFFGDCMFFVQLLIKSIR